MWFIGGSVAQAPYFGRIIALQIQAALLSLPLRVYKGAPRTVIQSGAAAAPFSFKTLPDIARLTNLSLI
jgi:hypothetical protein